MISIKKRAITGSRLVKWASFGIALVSSVYTIIQLIASAIIPAKYIALYVAVLLLLLGLSAFLLFRWFKKRRRLARSVAGVLLVLILIANIAMAYFIQSSMGMLDRISSSAKSVDIKTDSSFNIFISGIDTYGDIANQSRSDVNILATVNPDVNKVLLTTVPRDSYVRIPGGGNNQYDKLTHAGNYGVEASMGAVGNLLDEKVDAYVRINFSSFIQSIDKLGGVTVQNPVAFTTDEGQQFAAGNLQLNGKDALTFSRERHNLKAGDVDRGKNQQRVIQGIINKITSIRSLDGYNALLAMLGDSIQTNLSSGTIRTLINQQLSQPAKWVTDSYSLTGKGETGTMTSYAMPSSKLYMYRLDKSSIQAATAKIDKLKEER